MTRSTCGEQTPGKWHDQSSMLLWEGYRCLAGACMHKQHLHGKAVVYITFVHFDFIVNAALGKYKQGTRCPPSHNGKCSGSGSYTASMHSATMLCFFCTAPGASTWCTRASILADVFQGMRVVADTGAAGKAVGSGLTLSQCARQAWYPGPRQPHPNSLFRCNPKLDSWTVTALW